MTDLQQDTAQEQQPLVEYTTDLQQDIAQEQQPLVMTDLQQDTAQEQQPLVEYTTEQVVSDLILVIQDHKRFILELKQFIDTQAKRIDILEAKTFEIAVPEQFLTNTEFETNIQTFTAAAFDTLPQLNTAQPDFVATAQG